MINLSLTDLNRIQFREKFTGQLLVNVDKGRVVCNYHLPDEAIVATRESLQEITKRAGMINTNIQGCFMHNKTTPDAAAEAIKTLMHALIDISVIADRAHKHATSETEYAGAFVPHSLAVMQFSADTALNEAKAILIADCENGGVMRDDRFNSLKQEFSGVPDDAADALSSMPELIRAAFFLTFHERI